MLLCLYLRLALVKYPVPGMGEKGVQLVRWTAWTYQRGSRSFKVNTNYLQHIIYRPHAHLGHYNASTGLRLHPKSLSLLDHAEYIDDSIW